MPLSIPSKKWLQHFQGYAHFLGAFTYNLIRFKSTSLLSTIVLGVSISSRAQSTAESEPDAHAYAMEQRVQDEFRSKLHALREELLETEFLINTLERYRRSIAISQYPGEQIRIDQQIAASELPLKDRLLHANSAFVSAFGPVPRVESDATAYSKQILDQLSESFNETIPNTPTGSSADEFLQLSEEIFRLTQAKLIKVVDLAISTAREKRQTLKKQTSDSQNELNEQSGRFWRQLLGRDKEAMYYVIIGICGLVFMAAAALAGILMLFSLGKTAQLREHFVEYLRWNPLLDLATVFLLTITIVILGLNKHLTSEVLGTLIGGISGYVLGRASRSSAAAQEQEIRQIVRNAPNTTDTSETVRLAMEEVHDKFQLPESLSGLPDNKISLTKIEEYLNQQKHDRVVVFLPKAANSGPARGVLHLSVIKAFLADRQKRPDFDATQNVNELMLDELLKDPDSKAIFDNSVAWISPDAKLADAKAAMDSKSRSIGSKGNCYDVLVTEKGLSNETVIGIITNELLQRRSRV